MTIQRRADSSIAEDLRNIKGWESIARKWASVGWPRRPVWEGEFSKAMPLLSSCGGKDALVLGATPEFRAWLGILGARVSLLERSEISHKAMSRIMASQFDLMVRGIPCGRMSGGTLDAQGMIRSENHIKEDWEAEGYGKCRHSLVMGDIVTGYLEKEGRLLQTLGKIHDALLPGGVFLLRDFFKGSGRGPPARLEGMGPDERRWAYILAEGFAVEGDTFYEEKLAMNLKRIGDMETLSTCADPPRTRLMISFGRMLGLARQAGFTPQVLVEPDVSTIRPALVAFRKEWL